MKHNFGKPVQHMKTEETEERTVDISKEQFEDKYIICSTCYTEFLFSIDEQKYYLSHLYNDPKRCPDCRREKRIAGKIRDYALEQTDKMIEIKEGRS